MTLSGSGQSIAVKTNVLADVAFLPNLGVELKVNKRLSLAMDAHYNWYKSGQSKRLRHWIISPELRYWLCNPLSGHFFGVHALGGEFNIGDVKLPLLMFPETDDNRYEGYTIGAGISYGYHKILSPRWGLEMNIGLGFMHSKYERYRCVKCSEQTGAGNKNWMGATKASLAVVYIIN